MDDRITYQDIWHSARTGTYPQTGNGLWRLYVDLVRASRWVVRWPLMVVIVGYGQPKI